METRSPEVSIIMAAFNVASYIEESIRSVIAQTNHNWELIICDDNSSDETWQLISNQTDERIKKIRNIENLGASKTRNICLTYATGKYVAILDADDVWHPSKLEKQLLLLSGDLNLGVVGSNAIEINESGVEIGIREFPGSNRQLLDLSFWRCPMLHSSILFEKDLLRKGYNEDLDSTMDWALMIDLLERTNGAVIQETLVQYRIHDQNITHTKATQQKRNAFLVVQTKDLIGKFSKSEKSIFEDFFFYRNPPKRKCVKALKVLFSVYFEHRGKESLKRLLWFLKFLAKP